MESGPGLATLGDLPAKLVNPVPRALALRLELLQPHFFERQLALQRRPAFLASHGRFSLNVFYRDRAHASSSLIWPHLASTENRSKMAMKWASYSSIVKRLAVVRRSAR